MNNIKLLKTLVLIGATAIFGGCASMIKYPPSGTWGPSVRDLGQITANSGAWPLSLNAPPPAETYYYALRLNASNKYSIAPNQIVLDNVTVNVGSELDGTIRDWEATAEAGQDTNVAPVWPHYKK